ncbi:MAG: hypothetical protein ACE5H1_10610, partial [Thermodesulfobacteriota bacterium]
MAKIISGILALPRVSRNGVFYWPQELAKFDGKRVPLRFNHIKGPDGVVGEAELRFDPEKMQVKYTAEITKSDVQDIVDNHNFQVSLGAKVKNPENRENEKICHPERPDECFMAPVLDEPSEMSIVETPGMPESTLNIIENADILTEDVHTFYIVDEIKHQDDC